MGNTFCNKDFNTFEYTPIQRNCDVYKGFYKNEPFDIVECSIVDNDY